MRTLLCAAVVLSSHPVEARGGFDGSDWAWSIAAGTGGGLIGTAVGVGATLVASNNTNFDLEAGIFAVLVGIPLAVDLGVSTATFVYGEASGHDGSFLATLGGGTVGTLGGALIFFSLGFADADLASIGYGLGLVTAATGATLGYWFSLDEGDGTSEDAALLTGSLIEASDGLELSIPAIGFAPDLRGGWTVGLPLIGARF